MSQTIPLYPDSANDSQGNTLPATISAPHNMEAEQALLGALLSDAEALEKVVDVLKEFHFYAPAHQRIFRAIVALNDKGQVATPVTLKNYFDMDEDLEGVGGAQYLAELAANTISVINIKNYADVIRDLFQRRELIHLGEDVITESREYDFETDANTTIEMAESRLFKMAEEGQGGGGFISLKDSVMQSIETAEIAYKSDGHVTGVSTGLKDLDEKLGGLHKSDLLILAGRPSMGKTALAVNIGFNAANLYRETNGKEGGVVGFFSLEMSADQLATRILSEQTGISGDAMRKGKLKDTDFRKFAEASQKLSLTPFFIDDTPSLSIAAIRARARRLKRQHGLDLLIIDYLQLASGNGGKQSTDNRVLEVSEVTRGLKAIAKELQIPVLALSQLSRQVESREDKRPMLSDLRESGSIEQDSDVVMFVYREQYYLERGVPGEHDIEKYEKWVAKMNAVHNIAECIIAKQRHGPIGTVKAYFDPNLTRFSDLDTAHH